MTETPKIVINSCFLFSKTKKIKKQSVLFEIRRLFSNFAHQFKQTIFMKTYTFLFVLVFSFCGFAQNTDLYVSVPTRYEFQKKENEHQLNELTKFLLEKQGFKAFFENEPIEEALKNPCNILKANILNESGMFTSKLQLALTDCAGKQVFISEIGKSREKEFKKAYQEALRNAFSEGNKLANFKKEYKTPSTNLTENKTVSKPKTLETPAETITNVDNSVSNEPFLYAQPNELGFQLVDNTPKIILKIQKTSLPNVYTAQDIEGNQGLFFKNASDHYIFEYVKNGKLEHRKLNVKF